MNIQQFILSSGYKFEDFQKSEMVSASLTELGIKYITIGVIRNGNLIILKEIKEKLG